MVLSLLQLDPRGSILKRVLLKSSNDDQQQAMIHLVFLNPPSFFHVSSVIISCFFLPLSLLQTVITSFFCAVINCYAWAYTHAHAQMTFA